MSTPLLTNRGFQLLMTVARISSGIGPLLGSRWMDSRQRRSACQAAWVLTLLPLAPGLLHGRSRPYGALLESLLALGVSATVFAVVGWVAWSNRRVLVDGVGLIGHAHAGWLVAAVGAVALLYLCRSLVYRVPLRLLGYTVPLTFLWEVAVIASAVQQLVPSSGASSYAFLTFALNRRGVSSGQASLIALIDTLSYAFAAATLAVISLAYIALTGTLDVKALIAFAPGAVLAAVAVWVYGPQRDKEDFLRLVLRLKKRVSSWLGATRSDAAVREFLEEYYRGKAVLLRHRRAFAKMSALQYLAPCADAGAVYLSFLALGLHPGLLVVFLGFILSMAAGTVVSARSEEHTSELQ